MIRGTTPTLTINLPDDGTCEVNGYCLPDDDGIATAAVTGNRVINRITDNIVQIFIKQGRLTI